MKYLFSLVLSLFVAFTQQQSNHYTIPRRFIQSPDHPSHILIISFFNENTLHFQLAKTSKILPHSPHIDPKFKHSEIYVANINSNHFSTSLLEVQVDPSTLIITVSDTYMDEPRILTRIHPADLDSEFKSFYFERLNMEFVYGLGQQFIGSQGLYNEANADWIGRQRVANNPNGNIMDKFHGGGLGRTQFGVCYLTNNATKDGFIQNYALFLDSVHKHDWDFETSSQNFLVSTTSPEIKLFFIYGADLKELRSNYMSLTGRPPVPPKQTFGLWVSEYGYRNWDEVDTVVNDLHSKNFPVDGMVMDLQWFGGIEMWKYNSSMGKLSWDEVNFPNPKDKIQFYKNQKGISLCTIEESYVSYGNKEYELMASKGFLVRKMSDSRQPQNMSVIDGTNAWWGEGGMIDWTNAKAADYWHFLKRQALLDMGIHVHWTDLGEPEVFGTAENEGWYKGIGMNRHSHKDNSNIYNLLWIQSIERGYKKNKSADRFFILSRSGAPGMQRSGAGMWSGDIATEYETLTTQFNNRFHMSFSGIDYYGSDIGGFIRAALPAKENIDEIYTQWFADSCWTDFPVRPHTMNLDKIYKTSPSMVGNMESNRANIMMRYELFPYYYSLAHSAHLYGIPITPNMIYNYQEESAKFARMGDQVMVGSFIVVGLISGSGAQHRNIVLPKGVWFHMRTFEEFEAKTIDNVEADTLKNVSIFNSKGLLELPAYVKAGAIIPKHELKDKNGTERVDFEKSDLIVEIYVSLKVNSEEVLTIYEDDGLSLDYLKGSYSQTQITHSFELDTKVSTVSFNPIKRDYKEMKGVSKIRFISTKNPKTITMDGTLVEFTVVDAHVVEIDSTVLRENPSIVFEVAF